MLKDLKVGFIGCGKIAHFHADVLKSLGVVIDSVCYRTNRENAEKFAVKYKISSIYNDWRVLLNKSKVDFLWVVPSWDQIDLIFEEIIQSGIPAFFEKPLSINSEKIQNVLDKFPDKQLAKYQVGYNRRFYEVVDELKGFLDQEKIVSVFIDIPEPIKGIEGSLLKNRLIQNASHIFDLLFYLFNCFDVENENYIPLYANNIRSDFIGSFRLKHIPVCVNSVWNSPQNYCMKFYTESEKVFQLSPFEELTVFDGFSVIEPSSEKPIRQYKPKIAYNHFEPLTDGFKPGFKKQAENFIKFTLKNRRSKITPTIQQSYQILQLLSDINSVLHN